MITQHTPGEPPSGPKRELYMEPGYILNYNTQQVVKEVTARTLRTVAAWLPDGQRDELRRIADQVANSRAVNGPSCPVCQEAICDEGCPLERLRANAGFRDPQENPCEKQTEEHDPHSWSVLTMGLAHWFFCPGVGVEAGQCWRPGVHESHVWDRTMNHPEESREWVRCLGLTADDVQHIGRSWQSTHLEDACPCPKTACGLVARDRVNPLCNQHPPMACKTIRQNHRAADCPGGPEHRIEVNTL